MYYIHEMTDPCSSFLSINTIVWTIQPSTYHSPRHPVHGSFHDRTYPSTTDSSTSNTDVCHHYPPEKSSQVIIITIPSGLCSPTCRPLHLGATVVPKIRLAQIPVTDSTLSFLHPRQLTPEISPHEIKDH